jgi:hypothetical protein
MLRLPRPFAAALLVLAWLVAVPAVGSAATLVVSPSSGPAAGCTADDPCPLATAISRATTNDTIRIGPGDYGSPSDPHREVVASVAGITFVGDPGATLHLATTGAPAGSASFTLLPGQVLRGNGMRIESQDAVGLRVMGSGAAVGVRVRATRNGSIACQLLRTAGSPSSTQLLTSLCVSDAAVGGTGVLASDARDLDRHSVAGVTAVATGPGGVGIGLTNTTSTGGPGDARMLVTLSIAHAPGTGGRDIVTSDSAQHQACISTYDTAAQTGSSGYCATDETRPIRQDPGFVVPGTDFHLRADSPLVDAVSNPLLAYPGVPVDDLDGLPRDARHPEPGAFDRRAAVATTLAAAAITGDGAMLEADAAPAYGSGSARFAWGTTTGYGQVTPAVPLRRGATPERAVRPLTGLQPGTTYHARVEVMSPDGTVAAGEDVTFTTPGGPTIGGPGGSGGPGVGPGAGAARFTGVGLSGTRLRFDRRRRARTTISCPAGAVGRCRATLVLTRSVRRGRRTVAVTLARATVTVAPGARRTVQLRVPRLAWRRVPVRGAGTARLTATARDSRGTAARTSRVVRIVRR